MKRKKTYSKTTNTMLAIDPETRRKINLVRDVRRWNVKVTVDEVFNDYIARHGIESSVRVEKLSA